MDHYTKSTALPLLLKGFLGVGLLWQTACTNPPSLGMAGEYAAENFIPLTVGETSKAQYEEQQSSLGVQDLLYALELRQDLASMPWHKRNLMTLQEALKEKEDRSIMGTVSLEYSELSYIMVPTIAAVLMLLQEVPPSFVEVFITQGGDINRKEAAGWSNYSLLSFAAKNGHFKALRCLLEKGADASRVLPFDLVPYIFNDPEARLPKDEKIGLYKLAINNGLAINKLYDRRDLLLYEHGHIREELNKLLSIAKFPCDGPQYGISLLHFFAYTGNLAYLDILLSAPEAINPGFHQADRRGWVPWEILALRGDAPALRVLLGAMCPQDGIQPTRRYNGDPGPTQVNRLKHFLANQTDISSEIRKELEQKLNAMYIDAKAGGGVSVVSRGC